MRRLLVIGVLLVAAHSAAGAQSADPQQVAAEIAFLESRVDRDPEDPVTPTRLGHAYLQQARRTGDFALYGRAATAFEQALARGPNHFGALIGLANARAAAHRFADALALGERAIALDPGVADGYAVAGDAALEAGLLDKAAGYYAEVAKRAGGYHADTRMANLAAARGTPKEAYAALERAAADAARKTLPAELRAWCDVRAGALAFDHGDFARAERSYAAALRLTPDSYAALEHMAELRAAQGRHDDALRLYAQALERAPQPEFHEAVGRIHQSRSRQDAAAAAFARARDGYLAAAQAGDPGTYRQLALFFSDVEPRGADAVTWARKDLAIRQDAVTLGVLAWALLKSGSAAEAAAAADRAVDARPVDAATWYRAGVVAMESGAAGDARTRLARALQINPRLPEAADAKARLARLGAAR